MDMATNVFFNFVDSCSTPFSGSKTVLRPYSPPYISGSFLAANVPLISYTNVNGYVEFDNVLQGIYKVSVGNSNDETQGSTNYPNTIFYILLPETSGSLISGSACII